MKYALVLLLAVSAFTQEKKPTKTAETYREALAQIKLEQCQEKLRGAGLASLQARVKQGSDATASYNELVDRHNKLVADYNDLLSQYRTSLSAPAVVMPVSSTPQIPITLPQPREPLFCSAVTVGQTTSVNCR